MADIFSTSSPALKPFRSRVRRPSIASATSDPFAPILAARRTSSTVATVPLSQTVPSFRFFDLPGELRQSVYSYLVPDTIDVDRLCRQVWLADHHNFPARPGHFSAAFSAKDHYEDDTSRVSEEHPAIRARAHSIPTHPVHMNISRRFAAELREYLFTTTTLRMVRDGSAWDRDGVAICYNTMFGLPARLVNLTERTRRELPKLRDFILNFRNVRVSISRLADEGAYDRANPFRSSPASMQAHKQRIALEPWVQIERLLDARLQKGPLHLTLDSKSLVLTGSPNPDYDEVYTMSRRRLLSLLDTLVASPQHSVRLVTALDEKVMLGPQGTQGRLQLDWLEKRLQEIEKAEAVRRQKLGIGEQLHGDTNQQRSTKKEKASLGFKLFMRYYR